MRFLRATDYRRMPWKNGGGETREVLVSPPGANLDALDWRISLATIASDGPFSPFSGIQRTLCVIRGAGIRLQVANATPALLLENSAPYTFDGEVPANSTLVDGATVDLNVMTRRGRFRHAVKRLSIEGPLQLRVTASTVIVFCQNGKLTCEAAGNSAHLESEDCAIVDAGTPRLDLNPAGTATIMVIEIFEEPAAASS